MTCCSETILARPPSAVYQLRKLIVRHKIGFAFAISMLVMLLAFGVTMAIQAGRIARERQTDAAFRVEHRRHLCAAVDGSRPLRARECPCRRQIAHALLPCAARAL